MEAELNEQKFKPQALDQIERVKAELMEAHAELEELTLDAVTESVHRISLT